jgi:hypothetical protein
VATYAKDKLSGSTDGKGILITATAIGSGTTIHTAQASASLFDLITLFASNPNATPYVLTIGWGGTTAPDDEIVQTIQGNSGLLLVVADLPLRNSLVVKGATDTGSKVTIFGYITKIS